MSAPRYISTWHLLHLIISFFTMGLWIPFWIVFWLRNKQRNERTMMMLQYDNKRQLDKIILQNEPKKEEKAWFPDKYQVGF